MTEFETRLLRLIALGILTLGNVGLAAGGPRAGGPFAAVALICMLFIAAGLLVDLLKWLRARWARIAESWTNEWKHQLTSPPRSREEAPPSP